MHEARRTEALEIEVAGKIVAPWTERRQRRIELRLHLDEGTGRRRQTAANREPHTLRLVDDTVALDPLDAQHEAVGLLAFVTQLDKAGE
jgi:hypothetical protein